jgi:hypothetical protein
MKIDKTRLFTGLFAICLGCSAMTAAVVMYFDMLFVFAVISMVTGCWNITGSIGEQK